MTETRERFIEAARSRLDALNARLERMERRVATAQPTARREIQERLDRLKQQRDDVSDKLGELKTSSAEAWERLKAGVESAVSALEAAFSDAKATLSEAKAKVS
jgi:chromosome segregation ATPase